MGIQLKIQWNETPLTVLSYGGGQDSTTILYKIIHDKEFKAKYVLGDLIVIMADTKNEHLHTYKYIEKIRIICLENKIPYFLLNPNDWSTGNWKKGLINFYQVNKAVGSKAFPKTCTDNLKIRPIYNFLEQYIHETYKTPRFGRKKAFYDFKKENGKVRVLIGIARDEEKRASANGTSPNKWFNECINKRYPLLDEGMNRQDCQNYLKSIDVEIPYPSNCILCPFMSLQELLYLYRYDKPSFDLWVELENNKINNNLHKENKNLGVWGTTKLLPKIIKDAIKKYGHMSKKDLIEYKMSHGHCVKSKY